MLQSGWKDVWRARAEANEYSWYSTRGRGYRIDHALALNWPGDTAIGASYGHSVRLRKLSDHSMLVVEW
jgi:exodeoxyribonuclease III